jgi:hypothetical protein
VQLEKGPVCTPFEMPHISDELVRCMRYFEKSYDTTTAIGAVTNNSRVHVEVGTGATTTLGGAAQFKAMKRGLPTMTIYDPTTGTAGTYYRSTGGKSAGSWGDIGVGCAYFSSTDTTSSANLAFHWAADADF